MITDAYKRLLADFRRDNPEWGTARRHARAVLPLLEAAGFHRGTILDYGSGAGAFTEELERLAPGRYEVHRYEPSIKGLDLLPGGTFDAIVCTHVLEHVEPECLEGTLAEIRARMRERAFAYFEVPHGAASRTLPDGRNAHLIQESRAWWGSKLGELGHVLLWPAENPLNTVYFVTP